MKSIRFLHVFLFGLSSLLAFQQFCQAHAHSIDLNEVHAVVNDVTYDDQLVSTLVTVITLASHGSTDEYDVYKSQASLFRIPALARCKKIVVLDGSHYHEEVSQRAYYYLYQWKEKDIYFANTKLIFKPTISGTLDCLKEAFKYVTTPFVYIHQHDAILTKDFDLNGLIATMIANPNIKHVRLNSTSNNVNPQFVDEKVEQPHFVPLCRTAMWSSQDHISSSDYYRHFVFAQAMGGPLDSEMHYKYQQSLLTYGFHDDGSLNFDAIDRIYNLFGTYLYGSLKDGNYLYSIK